MNLHEEMPPSHEEEAACSLHEHTFGSVIRLYGKVAFERFEQAHVCVIGLGGVGSWCVEALARSGVGQLTLIDPDVVVPSNINRQVQATHHTLGQAKREALAERLKWINPQLVVYTHAQFILPTDPLDTLLPPGKFDYVIDAIDTVGTKASMIAWCRTHNIPLVTIGGAGGQMDPTRIEVSDLSKTEQEPLLAKVRKRLRSRYGFPRGNRNNFGIHAVYSMEPLRYPEESTPCMDIAASEAVVDQEPDPALRAFGTSVTVTACFGMTAAAFVLRRLAGL